MIMSSYRKTFIVLLTASLFLSGCFSRMITRPTVAIQEIHVTGLSLTGATLTFLVELENPNGFGLTVTAFTYSVYLNDRPVAQGEATEPISIPRRSVTPISLPLKTTFQDLEKGLKSLIGFDTVEYRIQGSLAVRSFLGRLEFPYSRTGTIDLKHQRSFSPPSGNAS
ncbi:MAG: LEA type 2 family protein [Nitrospirae bacterium]|nr:LEA type 2 family protein [Nitrospirota bacterium]